MALHFRLLDTSRAVTIAASIVMLVIPNVLVPLRFYVRHSFLNMWSLTDVFCLLAWACLIVLVSITLFSLKYNSTLDAANIFLSFDKLLKFEKLVNIQEIVYIPAILFAKLAVLMQLAEIFVTQRFSFRWWILRGLIVINSIFFTFNFFMEIFECVPRAKIWTPWLQGHCININQTFVATGVINVIDDFFILVLPISWTLKLRMNSRKKRGVCLIFATGLFACVSSVMRLIESVREVDDTDVAWSLKSVNLWADAEVSSGLIVCCLPTIPRLLKSSAAKSFNGTGSESLEPSSSGAKRRLVLDDSLLQSTMMNPPVKAYVSGPTRRASSHELDLEVISPVSVASDVEMGLQALRNPNRQRESFRSEILRTVSIYQDCAVK